MRSRCLLIVVVAAILFGEGAAVGTAGAVLRPSTRIWSIQPTRNIVGALQNALLGVSCTSERRCIGVGYSYTPDIFQPLTEEWDGRSWMVQRTRALPGLGGQLSAVACTSNRDCVAVGGLSTTPGSTFGGTLAEVWNGRAWRIQPTPEPQGAPNSVLSAVSCTSRSDCVAVGSFVASNPGPEVTLVEVWDGRAWTIQPTPNPAGASTTTLSSVSCASATACTAVGYSTSALTDVSSPFVEVWNGHAWTIQPVLDPPGSPFTQLGGVSCTSAHACIAVGYSFSAFYATFQSLIEVWDGHAWTIQPTPNPDRVILESVSCASPTACTAVGFSDAGDGMTLAEVWNGLTWTDEATPDPTGTQASTLGGVSCASRSTCTAVGSSVGASGASATLAEQSSSRARPRR